MTDIPARDITEPPTLSPADVLTSMTASIIPAIDQNNPSLAVAAGLLQLVLSPIGARRDKWIIEIAERLQQCERKIDGFKIQNLQHDEHFRTIFLNSLQIAIKTHQLEKLKYLAACVVNSALHIDLDEDKQFIFFRLVDTLTPTHIRMLDFLGDPEKSERAGIGRQLPALERTFPTIHENRDFYKHIETDLINSGLIMDGMYIEGILDMKINPADVTTSLARDFFRYISPPRLE